MMYRNTNAPMDRSVGYAVSEIITPSDHLLLLRHESEGDQHTIQQAADLNITFLPVQSGGKITGIAKLKDNALVDQTPLTADWLVAADTPILHLLELFARNSDRVFLVLKSSQIIGLVAPSDLNKIPARASIYLLTAQFEDLLAKLVRRELNEDTEALRALLSQDNYEKVLGEQEKEKGGDINLSMFYYLYLADLLTIASKHPAIRTRLGFPSRNAADTAFKFINELRNRVSHPSGVLLKARAEIDSMNQACDTMIRLSALMGDTYA